MSISDRPKFEQFNTASRSTRKWINRIFVSVCVMISTLSVIVLGILLTAIIWKALPTIGPHEDTLIGNNRLAIIQGTNAGNDPEAIDSGDLIQGFFITEKIVQGGLGYSNDLEFDHQEQANIGFYSFEVEAKKSESEVDALFTLKVPAGSQREQSVFAILKAADANLDVDQSTVVVLLSNPNDVDFEQVKFSELKTSLGGFAGGQVTALGLQSDTDFSELKMRTSKVSRIEGLRNRTKGGQLNCLLSVTKSPTGTELKPIRVLSFEAGALVTGHAKIAGASLDGVPGSAKRAGYMLGGELGLTYCPVPETDATPADHALHFVKETPKSDPAGAGIGPAILGSIWVITCCALFALPMGIGTAIFLEEFKPTNKFLLFLHGLVQLNISNLAGVPSIVYGILGLTAFATMFGLFGTVKDPGYQFGADFYYQYLTEGNEPILVPVKAPNDAPKLVDGMAAQTTAGEPIILNVIGEDDDYPEDDALLKTSVYYDAEGGRYANEYWYYMQLPFGRGVLAASLTLMLVILPVIIIATQEALRAVPSTLRQGALGLGSTPWQVIRQVTLPAAIPSIMTGAILAMSRAIGEAAPILILCGLVFVTSGPQHLMDTYSVLPIQIYFWTGEPVDRSALINFQNIAAAGIVVLLMILLTFNAIAICIRQFTQQQIT